jgi:hypothetical protein
LEYKLKVSELFKVIFQLEGDSSGAVKALNEVNAKYREQNTELQKQEEELQKLQKHFTDLENAKAKANNPTAIVKYNAELKKTREEIEKVRGVTENLKVSTDSLGKSTDNLGKKINDAFDQTKLNGFKSEAKNLFTNPIQQIERLRKESELLEQSLGKATTAEEFKKISSEIQKNNDEIKKFEKTLNDATKPPPKITGEFARLKIELKKAKDELQAAFGTGSQKDIEKSAQKVGDIQDKINSLNDTVKNFASGSKFKIIGNLFRDIAGNLFQLDFAQANEQSKQLLAITKSITFKDAIRGIKDLGGTLLNVGTALLANPIFLLGTVVVLLIANFEKLKTSGGILGGTLTFLSHVVEGLKFALVSLTDAIGLTELAFQRLNEQKLDGLKKQAEVADLVAKRIIRIQNSLRLDTEQTEKDRLQIIINNAEAQLKVYKKLEKSKGDLTKEERDDYHALARTIGDSRAEITAVENEGYLRRKEAAETYARDIRKLFDDLNQRIKQQQAAGTKFKIQTEFESGSVDQIKADFNLRKKLEEDDIDRTRKNAIESVENFKKAELEKRKDAISTKIINEKAAKELAEVEDKIQKLRNVTTINRRRELSKALIDAEFKAAKDRIEIQKNANLSELEEFIASNKLTEEQAAEARVEILIQYYNDRQKLLQKQIEREKAAGLNTVEAQKELNELLIKGNEEVAKALDAQLRLILKNSLARISEEERHQDVINQLQGDSESQRLRKQLEFEKEKLRILKESNKATEQEIKDQQNKVEELEKTAKQKRILENIGYFEQISTAAFNATNQVINAKLQEIDKLTELQQKRVDDAKDIAQDGNAELYELEQKRLDDLNKQRELFVRRQQALATIELIANTAIAVSKAAAQGGVAAAITIAAALIALTGGLIQARSIASQAAYYDGGYTGDGNPRDESKAIGTKPYTYHKAEFVMNHQKTAKYKDIFQAIHKGDIDLHDWQRKVVAYEGMKFNNYRPEPVDFTKMEGKLNTLIAAVEGQSTSLVFDEHGLQARFKNIKTRNGFLKGNIGKA